MVDSVLKSLTVRDGEGDRLVSLAQLGPHAARYTLIRVLPLLHGTDRREQWILG